jgi:glycosyltransferase involved in cell wall biosynthesis
MLVGVDVSRALRARRTGTERYALEIIRHLLDLPEAGSHDWRLYSDAPIPTGLFLPGTPGAAFANVEQRILPARRLWTHGRLAWEIRRHAPDCLFVPAHVLPLSLVLARRPAGVVTVHDLGHRAYPDAHTFRQRLYLEWGTRGSVALAARVIAVSRATASDLQRAYAAPAGKVQVIHEAASPPTPATPQAMDAVRARYGLSRPYALYVGTIQPRKNLARLIAAYGRLHRDAPVGWDLVLAGGRGWLSESLYRQADGLGLAGAIHFPGYVPEAELPALLGGARFFCYPSLYEGFGLPVLEAQQMGVPVMTANNSALPEVAGDAALLVDPTDVDAIADAMLRLSQDEALRQQLIAAGYENVKRFSWEKAARQTLAVLEEAAGKG